MIDAYDADILRRPAERTARIAGSAVYAERRYPCRRHNGLPRVRPLILAENPG